MRGNPILNSIRTAEAAGYPALLIVSAGCLGLVVGPVALLGLTDAGWLLGLALLYLIVAVVVLSVAVSAVLSEGDEPDADGQAPGSRASDERNPSDPPPSADRRLGTSASIGGLGTRSQPSRSVVAKRRPSAVPAAVARAPAAERIEDGVDAGERGAARSVPGVGRRLDARRARRVMPRTPGRRSPHQG
jgi:predicted lipid-binding transport protein (Tim44 family)